MHFGYNTNGFAHHRLEDALRIIADCGYEGVALTLDVHHCNPFATSSADLAGLRCLLDTLKLRVVVETGARFLLDPSRKHEPTLLSDDANGRARRLDYLKKTVEIAHFLNAEAVSFWAGNKPSSVSDDTAWIRLVDGCASLIEFAENKGVQLAFEPEPGMFVENMESFDHLKSHLPSPCLGLTLDVGHYFITETEPFESGFQRYAPLIRNVHIEDIKGRRHEHLMFGEGDLPFEKILATIQASGYDGLVNVELSRDSHRAPYAADAALKFLRQRLSPSRFDD